jgi:uncharacterized protein
MSLRVVFDTNVLFSAVGWHGNPAKCVELVQSSRIDGVTCVEILDELAEKLSLKLEFSDEQIGVVLASFLSVFEVVAISGTMTGLQPDSKDDKILECAVVAGATHVVTGDRKHLLPLQEFRGVKVVTPAELVKLVGSTLA